MNLELTEEVFEDIKALYKVCNWDWLNSDEEMRQCFHNSFTLYGGYSDSKLVCFGRVISDKGIYAFLVDVMVNPEYRKNGFANVLVNYLRDDLKNKNIKVIQLLSSEEGKGLYLKSGFKACPDKAPGMILFPQSTNQ